MGRLVLAASPLRIEANFLGSGGLAALAKENIYIVQTAGDLPLVRAQSFISSASIESLTEDVNLTTLSGSILDGDRENFLARKPQPVNFVQQRFIDQGVASGLFSAQSFTQPLSSGLMKFLNPGQAIPNVPVTLPERLNIKGGDVRLSAQGAGSSIGLIGESILISNPRNYGALSASQAALLSSAKAEDVLGVHYGLYRFLGTGQPNVNLALEDFSNPLRWLKLNPHFATGADGSLAMLRVVSLNQRVQVNHDRDQIGMYEYIGASGQLNLTAENYRDAARWRKVEGAAATDGAAVNLTTGMLVTNKAVIDAMLIRHTEDVNIDASTTISAQAYRHVNVEAPATMPVNLVMAGEDVILRAADDIQDNGVIVAALVAGGDVQFISGAGVSLYDNVGPFRTQIAPAGSLRVNSGGLVNIQQISADAMINGSPQPINDLFVALVDAEGSVDIAVQEGSMLLGYVTSLADIDLRAPVAILDAYPSIPGTFVNIYTPAGAVPGHVYLQAATIGSSTAPITIDIRAGELTTSSSQHQWLHAATDLVAAIARVNWWQYHVNGSRRYRDRSDPSLGGTCVGINNRFDHRCRQRCRCRYRRNHDHACIQSVIDRYCHG